MLTPLDIAGKHFGKSMSGYNRNEVAMFLKEVSNEVEVLLEKNENLRRQLKAMENELEKFNRIEKNINDALVVAQSTANQVVHSANEKADMIIKEAEYKAQKIVDESRDYALNLRRDSEDLRKEYEMFKSRLRSMLQSEIDALDKTYPAAPEIKTPAMIQALATQVPVQSPAAAEGNQSPLTEAPVQAQAQVTPVPAQTAPVQATSEQPISEQPAAAPLPPAGASGHVAVESSAESDRLLQAVPGHHPLHVRPDSELDRDSVKHNPLREMPSGVHDMPAAEPASVPKEKLGKLQQEIQRLESEAARGNMALLDQVLDAASKTHR